MHSISDRKVVKIDKTIGKGVDMEPRDIVWRLMDRLSELQKLCDESIQDLHPKQNADLISSIEECERLCRTQINTMNRIAKKY